MSGCKILPDDELGAFGRSLSLQGLDQESECRRAPGRVDTRRKAEMTALPIGRAHAKSLQGEKPRQAAEEGIAEPTKTALQRRIQPVAQSEQRGDRNHLPLPLDDNGGHAQPYAG